MNQDSDEQLDNQAKAEREEGTLILGVIGLQGHIDAIESGRVYGWAWNPEEPDERIDVDILLMGDVLGTVTANRFRQDLMDTKVGDGKHAFVFDLPAVARDADATSVAVYFTATQMPLSRNRRAGMSDRELKPDSIESVVGRIDRVEAAIQQMFRVMHLVRRGNDASAQTSSGIELEGLQKRVVDFDAHHDQFDQRLDKLETAIIAAQSFIDRFDIEILDLVPRRELDDIRTDIVRRRRTSAALGILLTLVLAFEIYRVVKDIWQI